MGNASYKNHRHPAKEDDPLLINSEKAEQSSQKPQQQQPTSSPDGVDRIYLSSRSNGDESMTATTAFDYMSTQAAGGDHGDHGGEGQPHTDGLPKPHHHHLHDRVFGRHMSSFRKVFDSFSKSERDEALEMEGVGPAAFLIRDAVLGEVENPAEGVYLCACNKMQNLLTRK